MQVKLVLSVFLAGLIGASAAARAQVAPAAKVQGLPFELSVGISSYDLDYGQDRRMEGPVIRAGYNVFHGLGVDVSARSLFMFTPTDLTRMQQSTFLGGVYYRAPSIYHVRPFARMAGGLGMIEFPSKNPYYTRDTFTVYAPSGGIDVPITAHIDIRGEYEYQFWKNFMGPHSLTPQGFTIGATYHFRSKHGHL